MVRCGHVYFLWLAAASKEKLVVPAFIEEDGRVRFFVINTNRTDFQIAKQEVTRHVLPLAMKANSKFLTRDCWLTCHEVVGGWYAADMEKNVGSYRGPLDGDAIAAVRVVIKDSRLYSEAEKAVILAQWPGT